MSTPNAFTQQLIKMVRTLPDEALLDLVRHRLDGVAETLPRRTSAFDKQLSNAAARRRGRSTSVDREELLLLVERLVKGSRGLSSTEIARMVRAATPRVQSVLRELKHDRRIFQAGDRRFARYAGDAATAEAASRNAKNR
jgi:hypothetical protein